MKIILILIALLFCANLCVNLYKIHLDHEQHIQQMQMANENTRQYCKAINQIVDAYCEALKSELEK